MYERIDAGGEVMTEDKPPKESKLRKVLETFDKIALPACGIVMFLIAAWYFGGLIASAMVR